MAGYIRQSSFSDGDTITAALFNNEYNQILNAFSNTSGHAHDGTAAEGPVIGLIGDAGETAPNNKVLIDTTNNYIEFYVQVSSSPVQQLYIADGAIVPVTDNDIDLGTSSLEFKDGYFDGTLYADAINFNGTAITSTAAELNILDGVTASAADINLIDGITNGTVIASKAIITDANKDITGGRNITISGELDAATLDISGDADIDGTLEADAITIAGVTLAETISDTVGAMVGSNTETGISVTYDDSDNTLDFVIGADSIVSSMLDTNIDIAGTLDVTGVLTADTNATIAGTLGVAGGSTNGVAISQGAIAIKNGGAQSYIDFYCESSNAHYARLQAPAHGSFSGNTTLTLPATTGTVALTSDIHTTEELQDIIGAMFSSNTESGITVTYQDADGTIDLTVGTLNQNTTGSAATLTTARTIHGVSFDGSANIDLTEVVQDTVGAMFSSNTETGIAATYEDSDGTIDLVIGADAIVNSMIADDAIDSAQIADGSIDTAHIADDQVTGAKLSNDVTIANDLTVAGNLVVTGSTTQTGSIVSNSNFQSLANNNSGNATDFGFFGKYVESSTTKYAGLFFDASTDNTFRLFVDTQTEPSTTVNTGATGYAAGTLIAGEVSMTTLDINGTDVTATAAELNILDGVTATTAELNYTDGVTSNIQTQLDTKATTGKAIAMALVFG